MPTSLTVSAALALLLAAGAGFALGYLFAALRGQRELRQLSVEKTRLETELGADQQHHEEQLGLLHDARDTLSQHFALLSRQALRQNSSLFLRVAEQSLKLQHARSASDLQQRQQAIGQLLEPIRDALAKTEQQLRQIEQERASAQGALAQQISALAEAETRLRRETQTLANALKRPDVRGRWGELTLKRLAELAGMVEHCDFFEQLTQRDGDTHLRPDMIVRLPDQRELVVDAKTALEGYLAAQESTNESDRKAALQRHARNLRERVRTLAAKNYWAQFPRSPDFVILFVPGEQFLTSALEHDTALLEDALRQRIILAAPTTLVALLRAVAFGWRQSAFAENAERIRELGEDLYRRIATLSEHFQVLGKGLETSVNAYNKTLGSLERQVLPAARRMSELGIQPRKDLAELNSIESAPRPPNL
ncbi:MAG: DNA recombination protein RmuC [Thiotrichales bacterium]